VAERRATREASGYLGAALAVLAAADRPLTAREILAEALRRGLLHPRGRTPEATLTARLYTYVRDHPDGPLARVYEQGRSRARRGSVRWALRR
jgi:thiamine monophosphate kinase